jgi:adenine phosphoribosyltransferase
MKRMKLAEALGLIRAIPDFPSPGILFQDITPALSNPHALATIIESLSQFDSDADVLAGVEARGFILGSALAIQRSSGFVPIRKQGKLPGKTFSKSYGLEYGTDVIEIHRDAFLPGEKVLLIDDVLATGGTLEASLGLIEEAGATISSIVVLLEIASLDGRSRIASSFPDVTIHALVTL